MPRTSEIALNGYLAEALRSKHPLWKHHLMVEQTGVFPDRRGLRPDILVNPPNAQPVVMETEYLPAAGVESDARSRLGLATGETGYSIEQALAVRIPEELRLGQADLPQRVIEVEFEYCVFSGDPDAPDRWPQTGWQKGTIDDLARCMEHAMVSRRLVDEGIRVLEEGVLYAARAIRDATEVGFSDIEPNLGKVLNQSGGEQTDRMAMTIIANALTFHASIAGTHGVPTIGQMKDNHLGTLQSTLLDNWRRILEEVNYWPIFKVASSLLAVIPAATAVRVLQFLVAAAESLASLGVTTRHDLSGRMFQKLIADRKFLATFYTLPTSSTLLAEIAVRRMEFTWDRLEHYPELRVADLSCGTGTLLTAAYNAILSRYRHAGGDDGEVHRPMMEQSIIAADIMPAAAHLCASQLSSIHPKVLFENTRVHTLPYGVDHAQGGGIAIGSLDLISADQSRSLFATGQRRTTGRGEEETQNMMLPHGSVDLVIMNPPFTRPTNHESTKVPVPSFAGFDTSHSEQRIMSERLEQIRKRLGEPAGHGNAGLASNFIDLTHTKVKTSGTIALVLPIAVIKGASWKPARDLLRRSYRDITVITVATHGSTERAFSADTGMAEALILATRNSGDSSAVDGDPEVLYINLRQRPRTLLEAAETAGMIDRLPKSSRTGPLYAGEELLGGYIRAPLGEGGCASLRETAIADVMLGLATGVLSMARLHPSLTIPIVSLGELGERGLLDRDIGSIKSPKPPFRGPFHIVPTTPAPAYPVLWGHDADRERKLVVHPDREGSILPGCEEKAVSVWETATRLHFNRDFRINSQSLAACCTPERTVGGTAWPNFILQDARWEKLLVLWSNTTLGLMNFWWQGSLQQQGRTRLTISKLPDLRVIDPRTLTDQQIIMADELFQQFEQKEFLPANEAYRDQARIDLDRAIFTEILGFPESFLAPLDNLRLQWCHEPSVHGGKGTRPN